MKKLVVTFLSLIACVLLLVGCNNTTNSGTPTIPDEPTAKTFTVNVRYVYRDTIIDTLTDTKKEGETYNYAKYKENIPDKYIENEQKESYFPDDYKKGQIGYEAGILTVEYQVKPKYEQYMQITTTNANTNGQIIPFAVLGYNIGNSAFTANNYDGEPVTFRLSEITEIKLFNTYSFVNNRLGENGKGILNNFNTIIADNNAALKNLIKVDLTECTFIEELPSNFFSGIPTLKTVVSNGNTKKLQQVGSNFLADSENIEFIDLDFSSLTRAGSYFLTNALINYKSPLTVNISNIENSGWLFMYQRANDANIPTINLILSNKQWNDTWFVGIKNDSSFIGRYYSSINLNVYTNYKGNIETALQGFENTTVNYKVYDMPTE
ncbi:MAG: hypothetical protein SO434_00815 [Eubacteriales bacterium]|nr:hypothetical protein [Eubacteriales bacterium]